MGRTKKAGSKKVAPALKLKKTAAKPSKASKKAQAAAKAGPVVINRAPVLELWVAVVAERQGFSFDEGLTFGKLVAGWFAQSKGRALGTYERKEEPSEQKRQARERRDRELGVEHVDCFGLHCLALRVRVRLMSLSRAPGHSQAAHCEWKPLHLASLPPQVGNEMHAVADGKAISPGSVRGSLTRAFGGRLEDVKVCTCRVGREAPACPRWQPQQRQNSSMQQWVCSGSLPASLLPQLVLKLAFNTEINTYRRQWRRWLPPSRQSALERWPTICMSGSAPSGTVGASRASWTLVAWQRWHKTGRLTFSVQHRIGGSCHMHAKGERVMVEPHACRCIQRAGGGTALHLIVSV